MAYDGRLDDRVADIVLPWGAARRQMFGGVGYLLHGNMMAGVHGDSLILRLGLETADAALEEPLVRPFDITGRPLRGWVMVDPGGFDGNALDRWLEEAKRFAESLPPK